MPVVYACTRKGACTCMHTCMWRSEVDGNCLLQFYFLGQGLPVKLGWNGWLNGVRDSHVGAGVPGPGHCAHLSVGV